MSLLGNSFILNKSWILKGSCVFVSVGICVIWLRKIWLCRPLLKQCNSLRTWNTRQFLAFTMMPIFSSSPVYLASVTCLPSTLYSDESPKKTVKTAYFSGHYSKMLFNFWPDYTWYGSAECGLFVFFVAVAHGDWGSASDGLANVGTMYQVICVLYTKTGCSLSHHEPQSVHYVWLTFKIHKRFERKWTIQPKSVQSLN